MLSDRDLLRQYIDQGSQAAFTTLVQRHINVVYRTALRRVGGNAHAADDVTQRVFMALTRKAEQVRDHESLAGWLYTSTRFAAAELVRTEQRRRKYEQEAHTMTQLTAPDSLSPEKLEPLLDEVLEELPERDREAVLLHFFERCSFVEIAAMFSSTADATRMRVNRALDRLRQELSKRGIASTAAALSTALGAQATIAATLPDAAVVAAHVLGTAGSAPAAGGMLVARVFSTLRSGPVAITVGLAVVVGGLVMTRFATASDPKAVAVVSTPAVVPRSAPAALPASGASVAAKMPAASVPGARPMPSNLARPVEFARFSRFTTAEKSILALLWRAQLAAPPGMRSSLGIGRNAPNVGGIDSLCDQGLLQEVSANQPGRRRVRLTKAGLEFCEAVSDLFERYEPTTNPGPESEE